eukprot:NODE_121_length_18880_cov_0.205687.p12 type:complete len:110 gc:universal NODE_121_length_18880_cov_0.205687:1070-741(-)
MEQLQNIVIAEEYVVQKQDIIDIYSVHDHRLNGIVSHVYQIVDPVSVPVTLSQCAGFYLVLDVVGLQDIVKIIKHPLSFVCTATFKYSQVHLFHKILIHELHYIMHHGR